MGNKAAPKLTLSQILCVGAHGFRNLELAAIFGFTSTALLSMNKDPEFDITDEQGSWIGAAVPLMALVGSLVGGKLIESYGRRRVSIWTSVPSLLGWIVIALADNAFEVILGRFISGFCLGLQQVSVTVYISETVHPRLRPILGIIPAITVTLGFVIINICGVLTNWRGMAWVGVISCIPLFLLLLFVLPETPYYVLRSGKEKEALNTLIWLRPTNREAKLEFEELQQSLISVHEKKSARLSDLMKPPYRWPITVAILLHVTQQATGMGPIMCFTGLIFQRAKSAVDSSISSMINSTINLITLIYISRRLSTNPRKYFLKIASWFMVLSMLVLSAYFCVLEPENSSTQIPLYLSYIPFLCLASTNFGFCFGWGPIPWMFIGESFPLKMRGIGAGVVTAVNWGMSFLITKSFSWATLYWGSHVIFFSYAILTFIGTAILMRHMPETFGYSDIQLENYYKDLYQRKNK